MICIRSSDVNILTGFGVVDTRLLADPAAFALRLFAVRFAKLMSNGPRPMSCAESVECQNYMNPVD